MYVGVFGTHLCFVWLFNPSNTSLVSVLLNARGRLISMCKIYTPYNLIYNICRYIYIWVIIPVRRWAKCHACQPKWVSAVFESAEKLFSHFSLTSSSCLEHMRLLVPHKSCRCYSHFCTTAKHSALTLCQAFCAMLQQRELEFFCIWPSSVL